MKELKRIPPWFLLCQIRPVLNHEVPEARNSHDVDVEVAECIDVHEGLHQSIVVSPKETVRIFSKTSSRVPNEGVDCVGKYGYAVDNRYKDRRYDALPFQTISPSLNDTSGDDKKMYRGRNNHDVWDQSKHTNQYGLQPLPTSS